MKTQWPYREKISVPQEELNLFAWASGDHNPIHLQESVARQKSFPKTIVHGMYFYSYLYVKLESLLSSDLEIVTFQIKFSAPVLSAESYFLEIGRETQESEEIFSGTLFSSQEELCFRFEAEATLSK